MTLVLETEEAKPGTHALVIGVGSYPHLDAGGPDLSGIVRGLRSLESPARSARAFATWLANTYNNPDAPIATIDLLISDDASTGFELGDRHFEAIDQATLDNIIVAANAWKGRGDQDPDGVMVFFFCGHGMTAGFRNAMLARDSGSLAPRPMRHAFDPEKLLAGMKSCGAAKQIYLFDACRAANELLFKASEEDMDSLVDTGGTPNPATSQAVFYSTKHGAPAYAPTDGGTSLFTRALLAALDGLAASDRDGPWSINTADMARALEHVSGALFDPQHGEMQTPALGAGASFDFHFLGAPPRVPFYLLPKWHEGASPPNDVQGVKVRCEGSPESEWLKPWEDDPEGAWSWAPDRFKGHVLAGGRYESEITMSDGTVKAQAPWSIYPPYRKIEVE